MNNILWSKGMTLEFGSSNESSNLSGITNLYTDRGVRFISLYLGYKAHGFESHSVYNMQ